MEKIVRNSVIVSFILFLIFYSVKSRAQNELPGPDPNYQLIPAGSLVIAMDNVNQSLPGSFNLKAYGLIMELLHGEIPVKWAITAGKSFGGLDFTALSEREFPSFEAMSVKSFRAGPFVIETQFADSARNIISVYGNNVAVYRLINNNILDIRYTLNFKPSIAVLNNGGNQAIHASVLTEAGVDIEKYVDFIPASSVIDLLACYTFASEPHWDTSSDTTHTYPIYRFIKNGSNFLAQCEGVETYEDDDTLQTTGGIDVMNSNTITYGYYNSDLPFLQIDGGLAVIGGSLRNWKPSAGSLIKAGSFDQIADVNGSGIRVATGAKLLPDNDIGGNAFFLGGHDYGGGSQVNKINGRRMYMNAVFVPSWPKNNCLLTIPLPVTLLDFSAQLAGNIVSLNWSTATELNNDRFVIEKTLDGEEFNYVGTVKGMGTTSKPQKYTLADLWPELGTSYYRITQVDFDGNMEIFPNLVKIEKEPEGDLISVYPNPFNGETFAISGRKINSSQNIVLNIKNMAGITVFNSEMNPSGNKMPEKITLSSKLHPGIYVLSITNGDLIEQQKISVGY